MRVSVLSGSFRVNHQRLFFNRCHRRLKLFACKDQMRMSEPDHEPGSYEEKPINALPKHLRAVQFALTGVFEGAPSRLVFGRFWNLGAFRLLAEDRPKTRSRTATRQAARGVKRTLMPLLPACRIG
jgi:hypothetical protein